MVKLFHLTFILKITVFLIVLSACGTDKQPVLVEGLEPEVLTNYTYYEITGITAVDLRTQMDQLGPVSRFNAQHDAYTDWYVSWSYPQTSTEGKCTTGPVKVKVNITFIFPKWKIPAGTLSELIDKWTVYIRNLQTHEEGHKDIAEKAGYEILRAITNLSSFDSCTELEQVADATGEKILKEFRQQEIEYDQKTNHGASQGARFP